jgi:hypothetical protein
MPGWFALFVVIAPALAVFFLALWTLTPWQRVWSDASALEVLQEATVHAAFYAPITVVAIVGLALSHEESNAWKAGLQGAGALLSAGAFGFAYLCARRRHQLSVLEQAIR